MDVLKSVTEKIHEIVNTVKFSKGNILVVCPDEFWSYELFHDVFVCDLNWNWMLYPRERLAVSQNHARVTVISKDQFKNVLGNEYSGIIVVGSQEGLDLSFLLSRLRYKTTYKPFLKFVQL